MSILFNGSELKAFVENELDVVLIIIMYVISKHFLRDLPCRISKTDYR